MEEMEDCVGVKASARFFCDLPSKTPAAPGKMNTIEERYLVRGKRTASGRSGLLGWERAFCQKSDDKIVHLR